MLRSGDGRGEAAGWAGGGSVPSLSGYAIGPACRPIYD